MNEEKYSELLKVYNTDVNEYIPNEQKPIYHYTSPEGLNGILSGNTLRFTDRNYLNDYSEGRYVMQLCKTSRVSSLLPNEYKTISENKNRKPRSLFWVCLTNQNSKLQNEKINS